jgi:hypothetical protein
MLAWICLALMAEKQIEDLDAVRHSPRSYVMVAWSRAAVMGGNIERYHRRLTWQTERESEPSTDVFPEERHTSGRINLDHASALPRGPHSPRAAKS